MEERRKVKRIYGQQQEEYDNWLFGLIKSKSEKNKEKQQETQRNATISLTHHQSTKVAEEAKAAAFRAKAAEYKALAAQKAVATANTILEGARASANLKNAGIAVATLLILGIIGGAVYIIRESKKSTQLDADEMQLAGAPIPNYKM